MSIENDKLNVHRHTQQWYQTRGGRYVREQLNIKIAALIEDIFGLYALQIGVNTQGSNLLESSRVKTCFSISLENKT